MAREEQITKQPYENSYQSYFISLSQKMLDCANQGLPLREFLKEMTAILMDFTESDYLEIRIVRRERLIKCAAPSIDKDSMKISFLPYRRDKNIAATPRKTNNSSLELLCRDVAAGKVDISLPFFTRRGSLWIGDTDQPLELSSESCKWAGGRTILLKGENKSLFIMKFESKGYDSGLLILKSKQRNFFSETDIRNIEGIAYILGASFAYRRTQVAWRERVKELTCLYEIAKVSSRPGISLEEILQKAVALLPPGWLYPHLATARITLNGQSYKTPGFKNEFQSISSDIIADGIKKGSIEVAYRKKMPVLDEGPFLREERSLIDAIAHEIELILERRHVEKEKEKLQEQLRHADRLATIGQLAAGVAHELNEPLGNILGFAQLIKKNEDLPELVKSDIKKIESASFHAREVIRKLMLFARQSPQHKAALDINQIVEEGLYFFESRCARAGIELIKEMAPDLPKIIADGNQLHQILVNLVVNAIQAIDNKGTIKIITGKQDNNVVLAVEDTGMGMSEEVKSRIFIPFFTTKDVTEGTGLGLAVVHGIVASHGGEITVTSEPGQGSRFEVKIPIPNKSDLNLLDENEKTRK